MLMILIMIYEYDIFNININAIYLIIYSKLSHCIGEPIAIIYMT